jgi:hypothetical protein
MNHLIFYTATNSILKIQTNPFKIYFRKDAKYVFIPEAEAFAEFHEEKTFQAFMIGMACEWKNKKWERHHKVLDAIRSFPDPIDSVSFFCHGWPKGIQFGFNGKKHAYALGEVLKEKGVRQVNLYACYCAKPKKNGGFAEWLAESSGAIVYGHSTRGHATINPYVNKCYQGYDLLSTYMKDKLTILNKPIIEPKNPLWHLWRKELNESKTFRFEFPYMEKEDINRRLLTTNNQ